MMEIHGGDVSGGVLRYDWTLQVGVCAARYLSCEGGRARLALGISR